MSDDHNIASNFKSFFTSIAGKLLKKIPKAKRTFHSFLTKSNSNTFFLSPTTPDEVLNELKTFNLNKPNGPNNIPVKILKDMRSEISVSLSRSSRPEVFLRKGVVKICNKYTGEHPR